ncbi:hypothetical protein MKEN_00049700 [Mycena kentingensis (nom. inval.)]|nr:hypothetical protein MKEN_00049700 [Mycena kentingensis (nom. inval.)]
MAPTSSTLPEPTLALIASARRRLADISEHQLPRLRACTGPRPTLDTLDEELRGDLTTIRGMVEELEGTVDDLGRRKDREELGGVVEDLRDTLAKARREARDALLSAKRAMDRGEEKARGELFGGAGEKRTLDENEKQGDAVMHAQDQVTDAMQRTMALLQSELERSVLSSQMLSSSTATLRSTSSTHDTLTSVMDTSKQLITALEKADWLDRVLIFAALGFFLLVVLFILKQRIFDRGIRLAFWWTRFLPDFSGDTELLVAEKGTGTVVATASSVATTMLVSSLSDTTSASETTESELGTEVSETLNSIITRTPEAIDSHDEL